MVRSIGGSWAAEQLIYFTIYYQLNIQFNIIKWELVHTFYFFQHAHFCLFTESTLFTDLAWLIACLLGQSDSLSVLPSHFFCKQGSLMQQSESTLTHSLAHINKDGWLVICLLIRVPLSWWTYTSIFTTSTKTLSCNTQIISQLH